MERGGSIVEFRGEEIEWASTEPSESEDESPAAKKVRLRVSAPGNQKGISFPQILETF